MMGHRSLAVTQRYMHPDAEETADVMNARNRKRGAVINTDAEVPALSHVLGHAGPKSEMV